ncbi:MAG: TRL-like family protein [Alphaproteobacteria bacterium]|nr:TRL-like family protein [Alphaproteobacteria bacterium]
MTDRLCMSAARRNVALRFGALAAAALLLSGCGYWPRAGNNGLLYTNVTMPVAILDQEAPVVRTGEACSTGILGLYAAGNSSVNAAKSKVGITKISTVEERYTHYLLGAYTKYCTIVSGT